MMSRKSTVREQAVLDYKSGKEIAVNHAQKNIKFETYDFKKNLGICEKTAWNLATHYVVGRQYYQKKSDIMPYSKALLLLPFLNHENVELMSMIAYEYKVSRIKGSIKQCDIFHPIVSNKKRTFNVWQDFKDCVRAGIEFKDIGDDLCGKSNEL